MAEISRPLRVALLGGGKMALQHATVVRGCAGVTLVAVADSAVPPASLRVRFGDDLSYFTDLESMLTDAKPDVVHVVTPPSTHAAIARACLEAGVHVYVEKPFALTAADAESMLDLAASKGLRACAAHQVLFQDSAQAYRQFMPAIKVIRHVESFFSFKPVRRRAGGGGLSSPVEQLIDILPHPVYLLLDALPGSGPGVLSALDASPEGEVRAVVRRGGAFGSLVVSLTARPVESYLRVMGTNGSVEADFVIENVVKLLGPGASAPAAVLKPFSKAWQIGWGSFKSVLRLIIRRRKGYPGLHELLTRFYASITTGSAPPTSPAEILATVKLCEEISARLVSAEAAAELQALAKLQLQESTLASNPAVRGTVLLTGGTGLLGRPTARTLQQAGWRVRVPVRRDIPASQRLPGIEYVRADLAVEVPDSLMAGVDVVVHAAAETAGDKSDHERNTIIATRNLLDAMVRAGCRRLVNISSVAVLKPSSRTALHEDSPVDVDNISRGPYVWAKAIAEQAACARVKAGQFAVRTIRLGPLVDYDAFSPPGRLGREVARLFVGMGRRSAGLSICSTATAAATIRRFVDEFESAPACVNLLEVPAPTRGQLADRLQSSRPDLVVVWMPFPVLRIISASLKTALKVLRPGTPALDLYAAFKSENYDTSLADRIRTRGFGG